jgi:hydroxymethylpyrimidine/phosphomethylpyrimidine kinase
MLFTPAVAMTIAGSDPSGGAALQADLKSFAACGVHGVSAITAVIAQNSHRVGRITAITPAMVRAQIEALAGERMPDALKTGALINAAIVRAVAAAITDYRLPRPVIDPVLLSSSGARLLDRQGEKALRAELIPLARIITPNLPEAEALSGIVIDSLSAMREAARILRRLGADAVVIKGGHAFDHAEGEAGGRTATKAHRRVRRQPPRAQPADQLATDLFFDGRRFIELSAPRLPGGGAHGTGCAFSAAIAAWLARGANLERAVREAKRFITAALKRSYRLSPEGRPILGHLFRRTKLPAEDHAGAADTSSAHRGRRRPT